MELRTSTVNQVKAIQHLDGSIVQLSAPVESLKLADGPR